MTLTSIGQALQKAQVRHSSLLVLYFMLKNSAGFFPPPVGTQVPSPEPGPLSLLYFFFLMFSCTNTPTSTQKDLLIVDVDVLLAGKTHETSGTGLGPGLGTCALGKSWPEIGVDSALRYAFHSRRLVNGHKHAHTYKVGSFGEKVKKKTSLFSKENFS